MTPSTWKIYKRLLITSQLYRKRVFGVSNFPIILVVTIWYTLAELTINFVIKTLKRVLSIAGLRATKSRTSRL